MADISTVDLLTDASAIARRKPSGVFAPPLLHDPKLRRLLEVVIARWHAGEPPDAHAVLRESTELAGSRQAALELASEEFYLRRARGESISASVFCARFPRMWRSLEKQLDAEDWVEHELSDDFPEESLSVEALPEAPEEETSSGERWPEVGDTFLGYAVDEVLGSGNSSIVYLCRARRMSDRQEVVKVSLRTDGVEGQTAGGLSHARIMPILGAAVDSIGRTVLSMPFLARATLCQVMDLVEPASRERPAVHPTGHAVLEALKTLNAGASQPEHGSDAQGLFRSFEIGYVPGVLRLMTEVAEALAFAHGKEIVHLDLKPSNILVGDAGQPWLLDFDLALDRRHPGAAFGGTPPYMSPEQLQNCCLDGESAEFRRAEDPALAVLGLGPRSIEEARLEAIEPNLDERSDIFSFGIVLYELLTGRLPFIDCPPERWTTLAASELSSAQRAGRRRDVPLVANPRLVQLIDSCLAFDPGRRPPSANVLIDELKKAVDEIEGQERRRRSRRKVLTGAVAFVVGAGAIGAVGWSLTPTTEELLQRGMSQLADGERERAIKTLDRAAARGDENVVLNARIFVARARARQRIAEDLIDELANARVEEPSTEARNLLDKAIQDLGRAQELVPSAQTEALIGYYFNLIHLPGRAIQRYEAASPEWSPPAMLFNWGNSYIDFKNLEDADRHLSKLVVSHPELEPAWRRLAWTKRELSGNQAEGLAAAIGCIDEAVRLGPPSGELYLLAGAMHLKARRFDKRHLAIAIDLLNRAVQYGAEADVARLLDDQLTPAERSQHPPFDRPVSPLGPYAAVRWIDPLPEFFPAELR